MCLLPSAAAAEEQRDDLRYTLTGPAALPREVAIRVAGPFPSKGSMHEIWARRAVRRIATAYHRRGYTYAEAFYSIDDKGAVRIHVDEGVMHRVVFHGTPGYMAVMFRVDFNLPHDVFHERTVKEALRELKSKYQLHEIRYDVVESNELYPNELNFPVPRRVLKVQVSSPESFGWGLSISLDSTWGLLPAGSISDRDLLMHDDRLRAELAIAVPYRRYLFDAAPKFRWVHGRAEVDLRFPRFASNHLAPLTDAAVELSELGRADIGLESALTLRSQAFASLGFYPARGVSLSTGLGFQHFRLFGRDLSGEMNGVASDLLRGALRATLSLNLSPDIFRRDYRDRVYASVMGGLGERTKWIFKAASEQRVVLRFGHHDVLLSGREIFLTGDVRYWDEYALAGDYLRVFFDNRYWVREAVQVEGAARFSVYRDVIKLGLFVDLSGFIDRRRGEEDLTGATGFGPSFNFLLFDLFALDVYYGFGFDKVGFDHNFSFSMKKVF